MISAPSLSGSYADHSEITVVVIIETVYVIALIAWAITTWMYMS